MKVIKNKLAIPMTKKTKLGSRQGESGSKGSIGFVRGLAVGFALGAILTGVLLSWSTWDLSMFEPIEEVVTDAREDVSEITFTFINRLPGTTVQAIDDAYVVPKPPEATSYWVRAASFKDKNLSEKLRASLLLQNLPAETTSTIVDRQVWHLVSLGPYARQVEAQRALTQLREQDLQPALVRVSAK